MDFDKVKNELITNHGIPAKEIVVATGEEKGLEQIDADYKLGIADPNSPVKFVITQKALAEGWDCPFAYILCSVQSIRSAAAIAASALPASAAATTRPRGSQAACRW